MSRSFVRVAVLLSLAVVALVAIGCGATADPPPSGPTETEVAAQIEAAVTAALEAERATAEASAAETVVEASVIEEPTDALPPESTEEEIQARIDDAVEQALFEAEIVAERERRAQLEAEASAPVQPIEMIVDPTLPDAYCEDAPHFLHLEPQVFAGSDVHALRIAFKALSDGTIWVAVEDDAGWPLACHVSGAGDWIYNPDTGWYHSAPIIVTSG